MAGRAVRAPGGSDSRFFTTTKKGDRWGERDCCLELATMAAEMFFVRVLSDSVPAALLLVSVCSTYNKYCCPVHSRRLSGSNPYPVRGGVQRTPEAICNMGGVPLYPRLRMMLRLQCAHRYEVILGSALNSSETFLRGWPARAIVCQQTGTTPYTGRPFLNRYLS